MGSPVLMDLWWPYLKKLMALLTQDLAMDLWGRQNLHLRLHGPDLNLDEGNLRPGVEAWTEGRGSDDGQHAVRLQLEGQLEIDRKMPITCLHSLLSYVIYQCMSNYLFMVVSLGLLFAMAHRCLGYICKGGVRGEKGVLGRVEDTPRLVPQVQCDQ